MNVRNAGDLRVRNFCLPLSKSWLGVKPKLRRLARPSGRILDILLGANPHVTHSRCGWDKSACGVKTKMCLIKRMLTKEGKSQSWND